MKNRVKVNGLTFVPYITSERIAEQVKRVASEIRGDLAGSQPVFICVLKGAFVFAADLIREIGINRVRCGSPPFFISRPPPEQASHLIMWHFQYLRNSYSATDSTLMAKDAIYRTYM